jgi:hypothetical protein
MADLAWWLQNFRRSAFRLETLPEYDVPQEAEMLARFKHGYPVEMPDDHPWLLNVRHHCGAAKVMQRVRIVSNPPSDYERFELSLYRHSSAAGEQIHIIEEYRRFSEDFWLFDNQEAYILRYDRHGKFLAVEVGSDVVAYRRIRDLALEQSIPFAEYAARAARP